MATLGTLIDTYVFTGASDFTVDAVIAGRFPTPPAALGFLTDVGDEEGEVFQAVEGLSTPWVIAGAVYPESPYLESTTGQIWPRIG